jgi:hypothetical protein
MPPDMPNPARGGAAGSRKAVCFGGERLPDKAPAQKNQAQIVRLVPRARPPTRWHLNVRLAVSDGRGWPYGRSRVFRIPEKGLDALIAVATRMEGDDDGDDESRA